MNLAAKEHRDRKGSFKWGVGDGTALDHAKGVLCLASDFFVWVVQSRYQGGNSVGGLRPKLRQYRGSEAPLPGVGAVEDCHKCWYHGRVGCFPAYQYLSGHCHNPLVRILEQLHERGYYKCGFGAKVQQLHSHQPAVLDMGVLEDGKECRHGLWSDRSKCPGADYGPCATSGRHSQLSKPGNCWASCWAQYGENRLGAQGKKIIFGNKNRVHSRWNPSSMVNQPLAQSRGFVAYPAECKGNGPYADVTDGVLSSRGYEPRVLGVAHHWFLIEPLRERPAAVLRFALLAKQSGHRYGKEATSRRQSLSPVCHARNVDRPLPECNPQLSSHC